MSALLIGIVIGSLVTVVSLAMISINRDSAYRARIEELEELVNDGEEALKAATAELSVARAQAAFYRKQVAA